MLTLLLGAAALAGPPTRVAAVLEAGSAIVDVEVAADGTAAILSDEAAGSIFMLDIGTWEVVDITPCKSPAGIVQDPGYSSRFWVGCLDGTVLWVEIEDGAVAESGSPVAVSSTAVLETATGLPLSATAPSSISTQSTVPSRHPTQNRLEYPGS